MDVQDVVFLYSQIYFGANFLMIVDGVSGLLHVIELIVVVSKEPCLVAFKVYVINTIVTYWDSSRSGNHCLFGIYLI